MSSPPSFPRFIAHYLPQFHPINENNSWWGTGFTEWTNVTKAKSLFKDHRQPILPSDLGFYDLRVAETRVEQAEMARHYGIDGFCYYHYWFNGKQLLERPINEVLASKKPDFPFCLCWANETWSRRWTGDEKEILIKQEYSQEDDVLHANHLMKYFEDERYIKIDGRCVFVIYRPGDLPNARATVETIKSTAVSRGLKEPFVIGSNAHLWDNQKILSFGFDTVLNFRPQLGVLPNMTVEGFNVNRLWKNIREHGVYDGELNIYKYQEAVRLMAKLEPERYDDLIPSVFVGWDNTARRGKKGIVMVDNLPNLFEEELIRVIEKLKLTEKNHGLLFINAWNEWAEGNKLEPDFFNGNSHLEVIKRIKSQLPTN